MAKIPPVPKSLPSGWQTKPTTKASFAYTVQVVTAEYGKAKGAAFQSWYEQAWAQDPKLTPDNAVGTWVTGTTIATGLAETGATLGQVPQAAATGAQSAAKKLLSLPGVGAIDAIAEAIAVIVGSITDSRMWRSLLWGILGAILLLAGILFWIGPSAGRASPIGLAASAGRRIAT